ncbi:diguanylate cyclase [Sulfurimonas sp.]
MGKAILCVDDEQMVLTSLKSQLHTFFGDDFEIELAQSGEDALEIIEELQEDGTSLELIISDFLMPGMKGDEFLIKAHEIVPDAKKMLLTGQANIEGITNIINSGALYRYISKPWAQTDLIVTAKEALKIFHTEKELEFYTKNLEHLVDKKTQENKTYLEIVDKYLIASKSDLNGIITEASDAFSKISGYTKEELIGKPHNILRHPDMDESVYEKMWSEITHGRTWEGEIKNRAKDGSFYWVNARVSPVFSDDGKIVSYASIRTDITSKKLNELLSITDYMTELYNRRYFNEIFEKEVARARRDNKQMGFVIFDVDYFKQYNDEYGHQMGDSALISIAKMLKSHLSRASDYGFRLGGEEFGIFVCDTDLEGFRSLIENIKDGIESLHIEHKLNTASKYVTASFGASLFYSNGEINESIIYKYTDDLLYKAKSDGRNKLEIQEYK